MAALFRHRIGRSLKGETTSNQQDLQLVLFMNSRHTYSSFHKFSKFFGYALAITFFVLGCFILANLIISLIQGESISIISFVENFLMLSVFLPLVFLYADFLETDIHVDESGLKLKSPLKTFHVKWEDIVEIRRARFLGIPMFNKPNIVITKSKLTPFHYLYGIVYARTMQPSFYFSSHVGDSDNLRQIVIDSIKNNRLAKQPKGKK